MKKIAIFVEGQTEQLFTQELIKQIFGKENVTIEIMKFSGKQGMRNIAQLSISINNTAMYFFKIYDCSGGGNNYTVKSDIREQLSLLK